MAAALAQVLYVAVSEPAGPTTIATFTLDAAEAGTMTAVAAVAASVAASTKYFRCREAERRDALWAPFGTPVKPASLIME